MTYIMRKADKEHILRAICSDYPRRAKAIAAGKLSPSLLHCCVVMNQAVDEAIAEAYSMTRAYSPNFAEIMRQDIADCRGFAFSPLSAVMCEGSYKKYKRMIKAGIAARLGL